MTAIFTERALLALSTTVGVLLCTDLSVRASRREAAGGLLVALTVAAAGYLMDWFVFGVAPVGHPDFFAIVAAGALTPSLLALGARRLRDAGHSGWRMSLLLVPVAGWLILVSLWCRPTAPGPNDRREAPRSRERRA